MRNLAKYLFLAVIFTALGLLLGRSDAGKQAADSLRSSAKNIKTAALETAVTAADLDTRALVLLENPALMARLSEGGSFGGQYSRLAAQNMFAHDHPEAAADVSDKTSVVPAGPRSWLIRMPIVNAALFETDAGLVLVDTGMGPAGPALVDAIKSVSDKALHTIIYTHGHVDHAYGTWALLEAGWTPEIIAHEKLLARFNRYIRLRGSIGPYMSQPTEQLPASENDLVWPTRTFSGDTLELEIGGERIVLRHFPGETDDQLFVWLPERRMIASADYYQGFLPNAGNGKRVQRYVEEWAAALREMVALKPAVVLPAHGELLSDPAVIQENLGAHAEALQYLVDYTITELNKGTRKDHIYHNAKLPEHLASHPTLNVQYVTPQDIVKMVLKQYTGWWDDIPSNWSPATSAEVGQAITDFGGGIEAMLNYTQQLLTSGELKLACHFADWLFDSAPNSAAVQQLVIDAYTARMLDPASNTQEMLTYLDRMAAARQRLMSRTAK